MNKETWLLQQLWIFKYLSVSQILSLWWWESKKSLYSLLGKLRELRFIDKHVYRFDPKLWRKEDIHFLRDKGASYLVDDWITVDQIKRPTSKTIFYNDYIHRKKSIDVQIALYKFRWESNVYVNKYYQYFETIKKSWNRFRSSSTKIHYSEGFLKADSIAFLECTNINQILIIEVHNGHRIKKIVDTIKRYSYILSEWSMSAFIGTESNPRILIVFEHDQTLRSTQEQICLDNYYTYLKDYYWFASYDDLMVTPWDCRINMAGQEKSLRSLFSKI